MNNFSDLYQSHSNLELLRIIDNAADYQPAAVEAAKRIFISRQVEQFEIDTLKEELARQNQKKQSAEEKSKVIENKLKEISASVVEAINPIQTERPTTTKTILVVSIVLGSISLIRIFSQFGLIRMMFFGPWDSTVLMYFITIFLLPISALLFYLRKEAGWWLLAFYLSAGTFGAIAALYASLTYQDDYISRIFPSRPATTELWSLIFNGGMLLVICRARIREVYSISKLKMFATILIALAMVFAVGGIF